MPALRVSQPSSLDFRFALTSGVTVMDRLARRLILRRAIRVIVAAPLLPLVARMANASSACADPASQSLRDSLHYTAASPDPAKPCSACALYTGQSSSACGQCQIMSGPVDEKGHCDSWAPRSG